MAIIENILESDATTAVGVGILVLAFPFVFPNLRVQWAEAVKAGVKLFVEAEGDAEGDIIDRLVDATVDDIVADLSHGHGTEAERRQAGTSRIEQFNSTAQARSRRYGWNAQDQAARYRRHIERLQTAMRDLTATHTELDASLVEDLIKRLETL